MDVRYELLKEHSKAQCNRIVKWIGSNQKRFDELFNLFTNDEYRVVQRAAWPVSYCVINHPGLIEKHFAALFKILQKKDITTAVKRNTVRFLQEINFPKKYHGIAIDACIRFLEDAKETVAVKAFSLTVLEKLSTRYPDIIEEVRIIVEHMPGKTAAIRVRSRWLNND